MAHQKTGVIKSFFSPLRTLYTARHQSAKQKAKDKQKSWMNERGINNKWGPKNDIIKFLIFMFIAPFFVFYKIDVPALTHTSRFSRLSSCSNTQAPKPSVLYPKIERKQAADPCKMNIYKHFLTTSSLQIQKFILAPFSWWLHTVGRCQACLDFFANKKKKNGDRSGTKEGGWLGPF